MSVGIEYVYKFSCPLLFDMCLGCPERSQMCGESWEDITEGLGCELSSFLRNNQPTICYVGVFAGNKKIPKGTFIGIYAGELLRDEDGEKRGL